MKKVAVAIVILLAAIFAMASWKMFWIRLRPSGPIPSPVFLPFDSWDDGSILPPLPTAEYRVTVEYERKEGGRLDEPLRIKLLDETADQIVPVEGDSAFLEKETVVGKCHLSEGHQYRIEVDSDQVRELGLHHHRLKIGLSPDELRRRWRLP